MVKGKEAALSIGSSSLRPSHERLVNQIDPHADKTIVAGDLMQLVLLFIFGIAAWLLPKRSWPWFAGKMAWLRVALRRDLSASERSVIRTIIGKECSDEGCMMHYRARMTFKYLSWLHLLRCYRPGAGDPSGDLIGERHVRDALAAGKGVILWASNFAFNDLFTKSVLSQHGFAIDHLSRPSHGFSSSRFGQAVLNPILTSIECRYLRRRIVIGGDKGNRLTDLADRLAANGIVSIMACALGRRLMVAEFLDGRIQLAVGAPKLAHQTGATVLPVFTTCEDDGRIVVEITGPLVGREEASCQEVIEDMLFAYVTQLEAKVSQHPAQFCYAINVPSDNLFVLPVE